MNSILLMLGCLTAACIVIVLCVILAVFVNLGFATIMWVCSGRSK